MKVMLLLAMRGGPTRISNRRRWNTGLGHGENCHEQVCDSLTDPSRYNLPLYWLSNQFSLVGWNTGSALVAVGLVSSIKGKYIYIFEADTSQTWQQSFISACLGSFLAAIVVVLMARPGAKYHIGL
jgi:hypothetical protein